MDMAKMLSFLLGLIPSALSTISGITSAISNAKIAQINATSDVEKAGIQAKIDQLESQRDVLIQDAQHSKLDMLVRFGFTIGPMLYFMKIFLWDKVWASWPTFETPPLETNDVYVMSACIGFFFLASTIKMFR